MEAILNSGARPADDGKRKRKRKSRDPYDGLRPWSAYTHGIGVALGVVGTIALTIRAWGDAVAVWMFLIYGLSMICLYTASTLYHCLNGSVKRRIALRKYDHCSIYLLIAGSYTPICILALGGAVGTLLISTIWILAALGIFLTLAKLDIPRWLCAVIYIAMGWMAVFVVVPLSDALPQTAMTLLFAGGISYTVGGVIYALKWPGRNHPKFGCHEIFHVFILLGTAIHFALMYSYVGV